MDYFSSMTSIHIPVSAGELLDRITILRLKKELIEDPVARRNVKAELLLLEKIANQELGQLGGPGATVARLAEVNRQVWDLEEEVRRREDTGDLGSRFVEAARSIHRLNDERHRLKRQISRHYGSTVLEEKSHRESR